MSRLFLYAFLTAITLSVGFPTYGFPFLLFIGFIPLLLLDDEIKFSAVKKQYLKIFFFSYLAFLSWNVITIWWLQKAKHPDGSYAYEGFLVTVCANALLMTLVFLSYSWIKKNIGDYIGSFFFVASWISFEKFHLEWEFTFPWLTLGNGFAEYYKLIQWYEFTGTLGGTLWILTGNLVVYHGIKEYQKRKQKKFLYRAIIVLFFLISIPISISYYIYDIYEEKGKKINVTIIQPELDPYIEKYEKQSTELVDELLFIAAKNISQQTDFIVCPETAFPGNGSILIDEINSDLHITKINKWLKNYPNLNFISGVSLFKKYKLNDKIPSTASKIGNKYFDFFNSGILINNKDGIQMYHKSKLVPGVEIFPYMKYLKPLFGNVMLDFGGAVLSLGTQKERTPFKNTVNQAIISPLICYEAIYGEYTTGFIKNKANILFMMSNDSWWGNSDGHRQLFHFSRLRAIETRKSVVRSANSGISAILNQRGDIINYLPYDTQGAINGQVQLNNQITSYVLYGDYIARFAMFIAGILFAFAISQKILSKKNKSIVHNK